MKDSVQHDKIAAKPTIASLLSMRAEQQPHRVGYTFALDNGQHIEVTYAELDQRARAIAGPLTDLGVQGQPVLLLYPCGVDYLAAFFGCLYAGAIAVPVSPPDPLPPDHPFPLLAAVVRDAMPAAMLTTAPMAAAIRLLSGISPELAHLQLITTCDVPAEVPRAWPFQPADGSAAALLQYTTGAASAPRGMVLTHRDLMGNSELILRFFGLGPDSRWVTWLPLHHEMGLMGGVILPLYGGFPVTVMSSAGFLHRPLSWLQEMSRTGATVSGGPDSAYDLCVQHSTAEERSRLDLSNWRIAFSGSVPLRAETMENFARAFAPAGFRPDAFTSCYGLELTADRSGPVPDVAGQRHLAPPVTVSGETGQAGLPTAAGVAEPPVIGEQAVRLYCWVGGSRVPVHAAAAAAPFADPGDGRPAHGLRRISRSADAVVRDLRRLGHGAPTRGR